jgi:hypothetical protein
MKDVDDNRKYLQNIQKIGKDVTIFSAYLYKELVTVYIYISIKKELQNCSHVLSWLCQQQD